MLLRGNCDRESGILLHISSLPSDYCIGSFGKRAYEFVDFLHKAKQRYWQILPLCPVGEGNSPYKSVSAFAGEILFIDLELLCEEGLLTQSDLPASPESGKTDYRAARKIKLPLLKKAVKGFDTRNPDYLQFLHHNEFWINDYALYMAVKESYGGETFDRFEDGLKYRLPGALERFRSEHKQEIAFYKISQFLFFKQYFALKTYAARHKIKIIGDLPFYVSFDSSDVWKNPDVFRLGRDMTPVLVAGVPPDIFSNDGQLWGNPIYDWDYLKKTDYDWWKRRLKHSLEMFDVIRIDHFRAFADYYTIPYGAENAKSGKWEKGAGMSFWNSISRTFGKVKIIAEDLGEESPEVDKLVEESGFPNMKVLQFAFNTDLQNKFLPKNYGKNCVCYTGTHDNDTSLGWLNSASKKEKIMFEKIVAGEKNIPPVIRLIRFGMKSKARLVIVPLQDYLQLDTSARMNTPGTLSGNWQWRYSVDMLNDDLADTVCELSKGRNR